MLPSQLEMLAETTELSQAGVEHYVDALSRGNVVAVVYVCVCVSVAKPTKFSIYLAHPLFARQGVSQPAICLCIARNQA